MGTIERFPQERVDYGRRDGLLPIGGNRAATILILPLVRIERGDDSPLLSEDTYAAMVRSFDELHEALKLPPV